MAEGARPAGGEMVVQRRVEGSPDPVRLGGIGRLVAGTVEQKTGIEARATSLGYIQRGGSPSPMDRVLATRYGAHAVELIAQKKFGEMVSLKGDTITSVPLAEVGGKLRLVPENLPLIEKARKMDVCFGTESC